MKIRPAVVIPRAVRAETARDAACDAACDDDDDETVTVDATARANARRRVIAARARVASTTTTGCEGFVSCAIISCFGRLIRILCVHASRDVFFRAVRIMSDARRTRVVVVVVLVVLVERLRRVVVLGRGHVVARRRVVRDARRLASARLASATFRLSTECILDVIKVATARGGGRLVVGHRRGLVRWCRRLDVRVVRTRVGEMGRRARRDGVARRAGVGHARGRVRGGVRVDSERWWRWNGRDAGVRGGGGDADDVVRGESARDLRGDASVGDAVRVRRGGDGGGRARRRARVRESGRRGVDGELEIGGGVGGEEYRGWGELRRGRDGARDVSRGIRRGRGGG